MALLERSLFQINVPVGNLPANKVNEYCKSVAEQMKTAFEDHGDIIVSPYRGDGKIEIIKIQ